MQPLPPLIRWNRSAAVLLSGFFLTIGLIVYVWWPLAEELLQLPSIGAARGGCTWTGC